MFPEPYYLRATRPKELVFFPKANEVVVYVAFFDAGLWFPLDKDLEKILMFYGLPLCHHSLTSISTAIAFLSLIRRAKVGFSLGIFCYLFQLHTLKVDEWLSLGARGCRKLINDIPNKIHNWKNKYIFVGVPNDFPLPRTRRDMLQSSDSDKYPQLSKRDESSEKAEQFSQGSNRLY